MENIDNVIKCTELVTYENNNLRSKVCKMWLCTIGDYYEVTFFRYDESYQCWDKTDEVLGAFQGRKSYKTEIGAKQAAKRFVDKKSGWNKNRA